MFNISMPITFPFSMLFCIPPEVTFWKYIPELLHKLGFSVQRPRKKLSRADHAAQEFWLRETFPKLKKLPAATGP